jgi:hypothetical protein
MNRRDRRIQRRRLRRAGVVFAAMVALGATAGIGGTAFANSGRASNGSTGQYDNCTGLYQAGSGNALHRGDSWHAADSCFNG